MGGDRVALHRVFLAEHGVAALLVAREGQRVADVVRHELSPDGRQGGEVVVRAVLAGAALLQSVGEGERVGERLLGDGGARPRRADPVVVGGRHGAQVGGARDAPHRILDVVALPVRRPVFLREAEGGLHVGADLGEHRVLRCARTKRLKLKCILQHLRLVSFNQRRR